MRKYISFILLVVILFFSNGYNLYLKYLLLSNRIEVKNKIKKNISKDKLSIIIITSKNIHDFCWVEESKEFKYKDFLYDVIKIERKSEKTYYYCLKDVNENNLIANYTRHNRRKNKLLLKLRKLVSNKYLLDVFSLDSKLNLTNIYYTDYNNVYDSIFLELISPPPKVLYLISKFINT